MLILEACKQPISDAPLIHPILFLPLGLTAPARPASVADQVIAGTRVLKLIAEDRTSKEIAELLKISTKTVENHRHNICRKLNIYGSHSLLKFAFDHKSYL